MENFSTVSNGRSPRALYRLGGGEVITLKKILISARARRDAIARAGRAACPVCGGTGWEQIPEPAGALSATPEQPWTARCRNCKGMGWIATQ